MIKIMTVISFLTIIAGGILVGVDIDNFDSLPLGIALLLTGGLVLLTSFRSLCDEYY